MQNNISNVLSIIPNLENGGEFSIEHKKIILHTVQCPITMLNTKFMEDHMKSNILSSIVYFLFNEMNKNECVLELKRNNKNKQELLINMLKCKNFESKAVIGNIESFWNESNPQLLKDYLGEVTKLSFNGDTNTTYIFDKKSIYFKIENIDIYFEELTQNEIDKKCKTNDEGEMLYNVTHDIYIPFKKDEINNHVRNAYKKIIISADVEFDFKKSSGCGIKIISSYNPEK